MMKTIWTKEADVERNWYIVDAEGKTLGRLASQIAAVLRGKHKPIYNPSVDTGDFVIVVNADKIHVTDLHNWGGTLNTESDVNYPCYRPWLTFTVLWDGRVSLCCADFDGTTVLGDLNSQTIAEIWNAEPYRNARREHLESGGPDICRACDLPRKDSPLWITKLT